MLPNIEPRLASCLASAAASAFILAASTAPAFCIEFAATLAFADRAACRLADSACILVLSISPGLNEASLSIEKFSATDARPAAPAPPCICLALEPKS